MRLALPLLIAATALSATSLAATEEEQPTITNPDWAHVPSTEEFVAAMPGNLATRTEAGASARLICTVNAELRLVACRITSEYPDHKGFGAAAIALSRSFRLKPKTLDGKDVVGGTVRVSIKLGNMVGPTAGVIDKPAWARTPTAAEVAAAFPSGHDEIETAHLSYLCGLGKSGRPSNCRLLSAEPQHVDFRKAGSGLTALFQLAMEVGAKPPPSSAQVNLEIELQNPKRPQPPLKIDKPTWWTFPSESVVQAAFPTKAREAKIATGRAILDCKADHEGHLVDCKAQEQGTQGLGFDEAALKVVDKMRILPWAAPGVPTEGASLRFLLRMDDAAPAPPVPTPAP